MERSNADLYSKLLFQLFGCPLGVAAELAILVDDYGNVIHTDHILIRY